MVPASSVLVRPDAGWVLNLYPTAGEAGGSFVPSYRPTQAWVPAGYGRDPVRARAEAGRRARSRLRRYCAANRLTRLGSLTYAGEGVFDPKVLRRDVGLFMRRLRTATGSEAFPYAWVPEWHKNHGLHAHIGLGQYVPYAVLRDTWGHGMVNIKYLSDLPVGCSSREVARRASGYLSKYVSKSFEADESSRALRLHRYEVAQGFAPPVQRLHGTSRWEVLDQAVEIMVAAPSQYWSSDQVEDWQGPPAVWCAWD